MSTGHALKTWPEHFQAVKTGVKTVELRVDDRGFQVGDVLILREWEPDRGVYTGAVMYRKVTHILRGGAFGLAEGHVALSIRPTAARIEIADRAWMATPDAAV